MNRESGKCKFDSLRVLALTPIPLKFLSIKGVKTRCLRGREANFTWNVLSLMNRLKLGPEGDVDLDKL
jgi:hypothetical protein